jgi:hypothetical protein
MTATPEEEIERAEQARFLLGHPLMEEAFQEIEDMYTEAWKSSRHDAQEERERVYIALNLLSVLRGHLESVVAGGVIAERDIQEVTGKKKSRFF